MMHGLKKLAVQKKLKTENFAKNGMPKPFAYVHVEIGAIPFLLLFFISLPIYVLNQVEITIASFFDFDCFFEKIEAPITTFDAIANIGITKRRPTSNAKKIIEVGTNRARIARIKPIKPINNPTFVFSNVIF